MKKNAWIAASFLALAIPVLALPALKRDDDAALLATRKSVWVAWFAHDRPTLERLLPADGLFVGGDSQPWVTKDVTLESSRKFREGGGKLTKLEFPKSEIRRYGDLALVTSTYAFEVEQNGKRSAEAGRVVEVFLWKDGRWVHPSWCLVKNGRAE